MEKFNPKSPTNSSLNSKGFRVSDAETFIPFQDSAFCTTTYSMFKEMTGSEPHTPVKFIDETPASKENLEKSEKKL